MMGKIRLVDRIKNILKYYPEEDELPIDWCPICEEKMSDNKRKTRIEHNRLKHPPDPKKKRKERRNNVIFYTVAVVLVSSLIFYAFSIESKLDSRQYCVDQRNQLNDYIRTEGVYPFDQQEKIDMLIEKCDLMFGLRSYTGYNPIELP